jgi:hypothetical protein
MEMPKMNPERYPWDRLGPGGEPELTPDFAARVIDRAHTERRRTKLRRRYAAGAICGGLALGLMILATHRSATAPEPNAASAPHAAAVASAASESVGGDLASVDVASAYGIADEYGAANAYSVTFATYGDLAGAQNTPAAQDQGDVFSVFLPGGDDVAGFESSYATASSGDWANDAGWDSNS